jgi:hypothetical protein
MLLFTAVFTRAVRSLNWGHLVCGADEREEHLRGDLDVGAGSVTVRLTPDTLSDEWPRSLHARSA